PSTPTTTDSQDSGYPAASTPPSPSNMTTRPRARSSPPAATTPPASPRFSSPEKCGDGAHPHRCGRLLACCADGERAAHDDCRGMHGADHVRGSDGGTGGTMAGFIGTSATPRMSNITSTSGWTSLTRLPMNETTPQDVHGLDLAALDGGDVAEFGGWASVGEGAGDGALSSWRLSVSAWRACASEAVRATVAAEYRADLEQSRSSQANASCMRADPVDRSDPDYSSELPRLLQVEVGA